MLQPTTKRTAILVDGGYYRKRAAFFWGKERSEVTAKERADELIQYCQMHLELPDEPRELYRIFYYDCPAMEREMIHPLTGEKIKYSSSGISSCATKTAEDSWCACPTELRKCPRVLSAAKRMLKIIPNRELFRNFPNVMIFFSTFAVASPA